jgi:P2 family phage contractile tail tube protein
MGARDVRKNINLFVDGRGYAGQVENFNAPKLALKTEDFRAGGMFGSVKLTMGMEAMDADFSLIAYDKNILASFGVAEGFNVPFTARQALESADGTVTPVVQTMRGKVTEMDEGTSEPGEKSSLKVTMNLVYYKLEHGGEIIQEIDLENMVHIVRGADQLAAQRAALGL